MLVKLDHFPKVRGENKKYLKPPTKYPKYFENLQGFSTKSDTNSHIAYWVVKSEGAKKPMKGLKVWRSKKAQPWRMDQPKTR